MRDEDLLSSYGVDNATFIYMVTEEEAQCMFAAGSLPVA